MRQDQLVQFCTRMHSHFSLLFSTPSLALSPNAPPREPIKAEEEEGGGDGDDDDDDEEDGGGRDCMGTARENSCTGTKNRRYKQKAKDQPNPEERSPNHPLTNQWLALILCYSLPPLSHYIIITQSIVDRVFQH
ncbi:hypothetical protein NL676_019830 [Syzygium grande]|nr:hypothetical protein NL676_019830 [Syzygium grande]